MLSNRRKTQRKISLFSLTDWKFHNDRLGYDDLIDGRGRLVVTVNVMDLARDEMLNPVYLKSGLPRRIFVLENDNYWTVYLNLKWLTPRAVQRALDEFGGIVGRRFTFKSNRLPANLSRKYQNAAERMRRGVERARSRGELKSASGFLRKFRPGGTQRKTQPIGAAGPSPRRLLEISTHKLKF